MSKDDEHGDVNLDSDEIDSDSALEEELKNHSDVILDEPLSDELGAAEKQPSADGEVKTQKKLKRKITYNGSSNEKSDENKGSKSNKIILKRPSSIPANPTKQKTGENPKTVPNVPEKVKITAALDTKTRLEMRAKKFGLPVKMTDEQRKEARKQRFGQTNAVTKSTDFTSDFEILKKRAERFGQSVSKLMTDIENKEKLEKRKAKFSSVK